MHCFSLLGTSIYICISFSIYPKSLFFAPMRFIQILNIGPLYISNDLEDKYRLYYYTFCSIFTPICGKYSDELCIRLKLFLKLKPAHSTREVQETIYNVTHVIITFIMHVYYLLYKFSNESPVHTYLSQMSSIRSKQIGVK